MKRFLFIDNGSTTFKAALLTDNLYNDYEIMEIPSFVAKENICPDYFPNEKKIQESIEIALEEYSGPAIDRGEIKDLEGVAKMWLALYRSLGDKKGTDEISETLILSEPGLYMEKRKKLREEITQMVFEGLGIEEFCLVAQPSLQLYSELKFNGIVVDIGGEMTQICPVENGYTSFCFSRGFKINGSETTKYLAY
jgi:actin-related protein